MDGTTTTNEPVADRVQVAHLFLKASSGDTAIFTKKEAEAAVRRLFPDLFGSTTLERLVDELLACVERDGAKASYSSNVRAALELIGVEMSVLRDIAAAAG